MTTLGEEIANTALYKRYYISPKAAQMSTEGIEQLLRDCCKKSASRFELRANILKHLHYAGPVALTSHGTKQNGTIVPYFIGSIWGPRGQVMEFQAGGMNELEKN